MLTEPFGHCLQSNVNWKNVVSSNLVEEGPAAGPAESLDNAKRRQIMEGAREVFLAQGFDAASMGEIARKAGVSKGTLYVYFDSKEQLFEVIVHEACEAQAKACFRSTRPIMTSNRYSRGWVAAMSNFYAGQVPCRSCEL